MKANTKVLSLVMTGMLLGCSDSTGPDVVWNTEYAARLNITPPIDQVDAMAIAAEAVGGTAVSVESEEEDGELIFEVQVDTPGGRMEVEVRASDGGVAEIEPADDDDDDDEDDD
ncbi:MAG TPA: PepSY domain-containing protein [Gemmatimonadota bacterium]|nr:PepSY domain-containing protein [Gemmatimonadota bacterium]